MSEISPHEQLEILRATDLERRWSSLDDKRLCLICYRVINGREVRISGGPGQYKLGCPTTDCPGTFSHWFLYRPSVDQPAVPPPGAITGEIDFMREFERPGL